MQDSNGNVSDIIEHYLNAKAAAEMTKRQESIGLPLKYYSAPDPQKNFFNAVTDSPDRPKDWQNMTAGSDGGERRQNGRVMAYQVFDIIAEAERDAKAEYARAGGNFNTLALNERNALITSTIIRQDQEQDVVTGNYARLSTYAKLQPEERRKQNFSALSMASAEGKAEKAARKVDGVGRAIVGKFTSMVSRQSGQQRGSSRGI